MQIVAYIVCGIAFLAAAFIVYCAHSILWKYNHTGRGPKLFLILTGLFLVWIGLPVFGGWLAYSGHEVWALVAAGVSLLLDVGAFAPLAAAAQP